MVTSNNTACYKVKKLKTYKVYLFRIYPYSIKN